MASRSTAAAAAASVAAAAAAAAAAALLLLLLLARGADAQGNRCPPFSNATGSRWCGNSLCFSGTFGSPGVLQRAPARAALYGATGTPASAGAAVSVRLFGTLDSNATYDKTFNTTSASDGTWKVLLDAMPAWGRFSVMATCATCASGAASASLSEQTFGDVWLTHGQSNQGDGSPVAHNFWRQEMYAGIAAGNYSNVVYLMAPDYTPPADQVNGPGSWVVQGQFGTIRFDKTLAPGSVDGIAATPTFFVMRLTDLMRELGQRPPPMQVIVTAIGGSLISSWAPMEAQLQCANVTCMCMDNWVQNCDVFTPITNRSYCGCNANNFHAHMENLVNTTVKGMLWWQGETDLMMSDAGSSAFGTGYSCLVPKMFAAWRAMWSVEPGTTDPLFPIGQVLLADGTTSGAPGVLSAFLRAQTAGYGALPNELIPNSFAVSAFDLYDPWMDNNEPGLCSDRLCCVNTSYPLGPLCSGDHRGQYDNSTGNAGSEHPRTKGYVAARLAQAAYATAYDAASPLLATGPVLSGCSVAADGASLSLFFDAALLKGESVIVAKPPGAAPLSLALENTALYVLVNASGLPADIGAGNVNARGEYAGPYARGFANNDYSNPVPGNEFGAFPWIAVMPVAGPAANQVTVDLGPVGGAAGSITAVRYSLGSGGDGAFLNGTDSGRFCCGPTVDTSREPCLPESCPIKASGRLALPAMPFLAAIAGGRCKCIAPQVCDATQ